MILLMIACGQYVTAGDALTTEASTATIQADVNLATRDEIAEAIVMRNYGLDGLGRHHSATVSWGGGDARHVDYAAIMDSVEARVTLADALANMSSVDPDQLIDADERLAFWLNLYNAWVIQAVTDNLTADPDWVGVSDQEFAMFNVAFVQVAGRSMTLNQIEHGIIRGDAWSLENYFEDPAEAAQAAAWHDAIWDGGAIDGRIHVALNCASQGCPNILDGAWQGDNLDAQLDKAATEFVSHPGKGAGPAGISQLFSWFSGDFAGSHGSTQEFIQRYRAGGDSDVNYDVWLDYSWELNRI